MSNSANIPALGNKIVVDIPALNALLRQMIQAELANVTDLPARAKQLVEGSSGWEVQQYNGSSWVRLDDWNINAQKVDGFSASQSATKNTIAVRDKNGALSGNLTGNAATASKAAALSAVNPVAMGGTGATTAEGARDALGVTDLLSTINTNIAAKAPTRHASSATTYGVASASSYGHAKASGTTPKAHGTAAVGSETAAFARGDHVHPAQTTVSGNAGSSTKLANKRTIDGVQFDGSGNIHHFADCSTDAATAAKTVSLSGFVLATGARVCVRFTVTNSASSPTLNVNSTGAKAIYYRNAAISAGYLAANRIYEFVYDGSQWELVGDINTDNNNKVTQTITTTNAEYALLAMADAAATATKTNGARFAKAVTLNPRTGTITATKLKSGGKQVVTSVNGTAADSAGNVALGKGVYLTDSWVSGASWYRKYSDGWIEQGGRVVDSTKVGTITFNQAFSNANYSITVGGYLNSLSSGGGWDEGIGLGELTASSFKYSKSTDKYISWYACGF